jgi:diaminopimelate epimerase
MVALSKSTLYFPFALLFSTGLSFTPSMMIQRQARRSLALSSSSSPVTQPQAKTSSSSSSAAAQRVAFSKYEGLGNDFILVDNRDRSSPSLTSAQSARLCDRNYGIGGDGVIFALQPPTSDASSFDFAMRIYNSDGSEPEMCGNGIRCMAQFLKDLGANQRSYRIHTKAGPIVPVMNDDNSITVDMGAPVLATSKVPTTLPANDVAMDSALLQTYECNGKTWQISAVSMGNPHAIIFVNNVETDIDFASDGPALECAAAFPAKTNVEFVQVLAVDHVRVKVWERGAGPTLACGTGACAVAVAAIRAGRVKAERPIRVSLPGGDLVIQWDQVANKVYMTGPATFAFEGTAVVH